MKVSQTITKQYLTDKILKHLKSNNNKKATDSQKQAACRSVSKTRVTFGVTQAIFILKDPVSQVTIAMATIRQATQLITVGSNCTACSFALCEFYPIPCKHGMSIKLTQQSKFGKGLLTGKADYTLVTEHVIA